MYQMLKFEFIKRYKELKVYFLFYLCVLLVSLVIPSDFANGMAIKICSISGGLYFITIYIYLIVITTYEFRIPYVNKDKNVTKKPWEIIGVKMINNIIYMTIIYGTTILLSLALNRFATDTVTSLPITNNYFYVILLGLLISLLILFFFLLSKNITLTKKNPAISTIIMILITVEIATPFFNQNENNQIMNPYFAVISFIVSIILFFICCILYEQTYDHAKIVKNDNIKFK